MMMHRVPTKYSRPPLQARSGGGVELRHPIKPLFERGATRFVRDLIQYVYLGTSVGDLSQTLHEHRLTADALSLQEFLPFDGAARSKWDDTIAGLLKLADAAVQAAQDAGDWNNDWIDLETDASGAARMIYDRLAALVAFARQTWGPDAAAKLLAAAIDRLKNQRHALSAATPVWQSNNSKRLQDTATKLRAFARPSKRWVRTLLQYRKKTSLRRFLTLTQGRAIDDAVIEINKFTAIRQRQLVARGRQAAYDRLLGDGTKQGSLAELLDGVRTEKEFYRDMLAAVPVESSPIKPDCDTQLLLVDDLNVVLDPRAPAGKRTLEELMTRRFALAGCTPEALARRIRDEGVTLDGRIVRTHDWAKEIPAELAGVLSAETARYLGAEEPLCLERPRTALDHFATIHLLSPEMRHRLLEVLPTVIARSGPYAEFSTFNDVRSVRQNHFYCAPEHRGKWLVLLQNFVRVMDAQQAEEFSFAHPFAIVLEQKYLAAPAGNYRKLWKWYSAANRARRVSGDTAHFIDHRQFPEIRLLDERVRDHDDCAKLLAAGVKAGIAAPIGAAGCLTLAKPDPRLDGLFCRLVREPAWTTPEHFQQLLKNDVWFAPFVAAIMPTLTGFQQDAVRLARENDAHRVADKLEQLGVIERRGGQCRMVVTPSAVVATEVPPGLYVEQLGATDGLSPDDFVTVLLQHDLLYSVMFFAALDALDWGRLTENDVPESVLVVHRSLLA